MFNSIYFRMQVKIFANKKIQKNIPSIFGELFENLISFELYKINV